MLLHAIEGDDSNGKKHAITAIDGASATALMWFVHLTHPGLFDRLFLKGSLSRTGLVVVLAAPFAMAFSLGNILFYGALKPRRTGPMSAYLDGQDSQKAWKIAVTAGFVVAANFLFMLVTAIK